MNNTRVNRLWVLLATLLLFVNIFTLVNKVTPAYGAIDKTAEEVFIKSQTMGNVKLRIWRSKKPSDKTLILLDGMRARNDYSGWELYTNVQNIVRNAGVNLVEPVGGESSYYMDWISPSSTNNQKYRYTWETFLTKNMPIGLKKIGIPTKNMGIVGISMAASSALAMAAYHPNLFNYAGSISGYLSLNAPGIGLAIRLSMLEAGNYNIDNMWGPPWGSGWYKYDPMVFMDKLIKYNKRIWVGQGNGLTGPYEVGRKDSQNVIAGMGLEAMSVFTARLFQLETVVKGYRNAMFDYTPNGIHNWPYWEDQVKRMLPDMVNYIGNNPRKEDYFPCSGALIPHFFNIIN